MAGADGRTPEQIRAEIGVERAELEVAVDEFREDVKRVARIAGTVAFALASLRVLRRLRRR